MENKEIERLDEEFKEYETKMEAMMVTYKFREKSLASEWMTKLKEANGSVEERKLRNRFINHFVESSEAAGGLGGVFRSGPFKKLPSNFKEALINYKFMLPKSPEEALNPTEEEKQAYISDLFQNLPDKGKFLAAQPVPKEGTFFILVTVNTCSQKNP